MSSNALQMNVDLAQLTQKIRKQIDSISDLPLGQTAEERGASPIGAQSLECLRATDREFNTLRLRLESGEPLPQARGLRAGLGTRIKRRLYRLLWWQTNQIRELVTLTIRRGQEEVSTFQALSENIGSQSAEISRLKQSLLECKQQLRDSENRQRQLESAQLRLQAAEIERNVKSSIQLETSFASLRQELMAVFDRRIELATGQLNERINSLAAQQRETTSRVSELGLSAHQTRTTLSLQDRRIAVFLEEARRRLGEPLAVDQLDRVVNEHHDHRYDSLYLAFEDLFRGSREEIKARQSIYLPLLKDSGIGSAEMPILDVGCGRGEWLELLREHSLQASGVDRNEAMVEYCERAGLQIATSDALPHLRSLSDSSLGCITSFHMVEHLPFEVTLALVDEALRILKSGGILIL